jgi:polyhydroxyalkanoate synthesis regulator phasin
MKNVSLHSSIVKYSVILLLGAIVAFVIAIARPQIVFAQSDTAVRSELTSLRSRVTRLESEIRSGAGRNRTGEVRQSPGQNVPAQTINGETIGETDPMFQRLANLTIELKERVATLEKQIKQLEQKTTSQ